VEGKRIRLEPENRAIGIVVAQQLREPWPISKRGKIEIEKFDQDVTRKRSI